MSDKEREMEIRVAKLELRVARVKARLRKYHVTVGNIGTVYLGPDEQKAEAAYVEYVRQSTTNYGRAAGESVIMFEYDEILKEHVGGQHETEE